MLVKPDYSEIRDIVGPGNYKVTVVGCEVKDWPNGGQYLNWKMETYGEADAKNNGRTIFHKTPTSGKGAFRLQQFYTAVTGQTINPEKPSFDTEQLLGGKAEVVVVDGTDKEGNLTGYTDIKTVRAIKQ